MRSGHSHTQLYIACFLINLRIYTYVKDIRICITCSGWFFDNKSRERERESARSSLTTYYVFIIYITGNIENSDVI